ncbi:hypothetical protein DM860_001198 [Cuscuta australis]|uniref:Uncharacterized protein n=1 Tax=Cuscuta australis TaxID=267555 RepID=A0A328DWM6_9ASTE|nr:hypothetical protein DM860_001198 [Cuscuta australis]
MTSWLPQNRLQRKDREVSVRDVAGDPIDDGANIDKDEAGSSDGLEWRPETPNGDCSANRRKKSSAYGYLLCFAQRFSFKSAVESQKSRHFFRGFLVVEETQKGTIDKHKIKDGDVGEEDGDGYWICFR